LEEALEGRRQVIFVTGEAGIGKSTLVEAALERVAADHHVCVARGQCLEQYGASEAYLPVLDALARLCRGTGRELLVSLLKTQAPTWLAQMPWLTGAAEREALQREVVGATRERMLREMAEMVETLTASVPIALLLEDLHWSDYSTLDLISYLARRREPARLLLLGTYRPADVSLSQRPLTAIKQELQMHRQCEELRLTFLTEDAIAEYLATRFPEHRFPAEFARLLHQRTEGNPLFLVNLVDYLLTGRLIGQTEGRWTMNAAVPEVELGVPESIRQMIENQVNNLGKEEQRVLETASVAGVEFSALAVACGLDTDVIRVEESCDELARRQQFLRPVGSHTLPGGLLTTRYSFIHALYQNAIYERVAAARRARLHQRIGERWENIYGEAAGEIAAELAMRFEQGGDFGRALKYLQQAAENATRRFANREAAGLARHGLELLGLLPETSDRVRQELMLQIALCVPLAATEGYGSAEVEKHYDRARELCRQLGESSHLSSVLSGLLRFYIIRARLAEARDMAQQLLRVAESEQDTTLLVEAHFALGVAFVNMGEFRLAWEHLERGISLYDPRQQSAYLFFYGHDPGVVCRAFGSWALWSLGYTDQAQERNREALAAARELRHPETLCFALFFAAWMYQLRCESQKTLALAEAVIAHANEHGLAQWSAFGTSLHGWALAKAGQRGEGIKQMRAALAAYKAIGSEISRPHFLALLAEALAEDGQLEEGLNILAEAMAAAENSGDRYYEAELCRLRGELSLRLDADKQSAESRAKENYLRAIEIARQQNARAFELRTALSLCRLWKQQGRRAEAHSMLSEIYDWFTEGFDTSEIKEARALIEELS
jgi:predicted ATPase